MNKFVLALLTLIIVNTYSYAQEYNEKQIENEDVTTIEMTENISPDEAIEADEN